ncbi:type VII secretion integral membrane protein EccD [Streptomyces sp. NPDC101152]|uniref:type VII secretion integral membrane protein EccD n=1 Tax=Streptomyces sp. NPDC101152 TaxID=3366116 RepID=UPI0038098B6F
MTTPVSAPRTPGAVSTEVCRLTIAGPAGRADLAVPVTTRVSALLSVLMRHIPTDPARPAGAWVLQRLGEAPLGLDATPQSAGLYHGDVLYLRPADDPMPELEFDDAADGVAHAVGSELDRWRPELTRRLFLALACLVLAALAAAVPWAGHGSSVPVLYGVATVVLGAGCALDQRRPADRATGLITGIGACVFAGLTGLSAVHGTAGLLSPRHTDVVLGAGAAVLVSAAVLSIPRLPLAATGTTLLTAALAAVTGCLAASSGWNAAHSTSTVAVVFFLFGHLAPRAALRLARIRVPQLPRNAEELQEDIDPLPEHLLTRRAATADAILTVVSVSNGLLCSTAFVLLAGERGWIGWLFPLVFSGALLLRSKSLQAPWQRIPEAFGGVLGLLTVVLSWSASASSLATRSALLLGLLVAAVLLLVGAWRLPRVRLLPVWGHTADILELLTALALLPLLLQLLHTYAYFRVLVS